MNVLKVKTPAKINLTLEVLNKRPDGFHNIQSIMQAISLYDYLTFRVENGEGIKISLSGNCDKIPYDENNLVYKAAKSFFEKAKIENVNLSIDIEKNIPIAAGLAGGSANAAGTLYGLNILFNNILSEEQIDEICSKLGSDLNFCLKGGCAFCTSRGEIIENIPFLEQKVSLIKPKNIGISAKEAYVCFSEIKNKSIPNNTVKLKNLLLNGEFDSSLLFNSLEEGLFKKYKELQYIKDNVKNSLMTGSGSTFFVLADKIGINSDKNNYEIFENLKTIGKGVEVFNE